MLAFGGGLRRRQNVSLIGTLIVITFFVLWLPSAHSQTIVQQTFGMCSPAVGNVQGNVTMVLNCKGTTGNIAIPAFKGSFAARKDINRFIDFLMRNRGRVAFLNLTFEIGDNIIRWDWADSHNSKEEQADVNTCESAGDSALCLSVKKTDQWDGGLMRITDYWTDSSCTHQKEKQIQCIPCQHGFCDIHGFFEVKDLGMGQGFVFPNLDAIPMKSIIANPQFLLPNSR